MHESSLQRVSYFLISLVGIIFIAIIARSFLIPFFFALFFALMLLPLSIWVEKLVRNRILAIFITLLMVMIPILLVMSFFSYQFVGIFDNIGQIGDQIKEGFDNLISFAAQTKLVSAYEIQNSLNGNLDKIAENSMKWIQSFLSGSSAFLSGLVLTIIYLFFMLLYAMPFKQFLFVQVQPNRRKHFQNLMSRVQKVSFKYLIGMLTVMLILAVANSLGLWIIGIDFPVFWGSLAAILVILPYIGSILGGVLPFLYAIPTTDSWTQPLLVAGLFIIIQTVEGNYITPKIVGKSVAINPFFAILALVIGGAIWGIPGMILAIPLMSIIRIIFSELDPLKPVAVLMGDELREKADDMAQDYKEARFSFWQWLTRGSRSYSGQKEEE